MRAPLTTTKVSVKIRKSESIANVWNVYLESYPVFEKGKAIRRREAINRSITTVEFDKKRVSRKDKDGSTNYHPRRDINGIILCKSSRDKETMIFADKLRNMRQADFDRKFYASDADKKLMDYQKKQKRIFKDYFNEIAITRNRNSSESIKVNWSCTGRYLDIFLGGDIIAFSDINDKWCLEFRESLIGAKSFAKNTDCLSSASASTYFSIFKAALRQAYIDGYFNEDFSGRLKNIPVRNAQREVLSLEELNTLVGTPCEQPVVKRAAIFSALTGIRHVDIKKMRWGDISKYDEQYRITFVQQKTGEVNYLPISEQAYIVCGVPGNSDELVFSGLPNPSWVSRPLKKWIKSAGITRNITFHSFRHTFATLQLEQGTNLFIVSKMLGHRNIKTTQIYAHVTSSEKNKVANAICVDLEGNM